MTMLANSGEICELIKVPKRCYSAKIEQCKWLVNLTTTQILEDVSDIVTVSPNFSVSQKTSKNHVQGGH